MPFAVRFKKNADANRERVAGNSSTPRSLLAWQLWKVGGTSNPLAFHQFMKSAAL